jgi:hypothetical protein
MVCRNCLLGCDSVLRRIGFCCTRCLVLALGLFLAVGIPGGFGSAQTINPPSAGEQEIFQYYYLFFSRLESLDKAIAYAVSKGKDPKGFRRLLMDEAGLNEVEDGAVKTIARRCNAAVKDNRRARAEVENRMKTEYPDVSRIPDTLREQNVNLARRDAFIVLDCVEEMKNELGSKFQGLDAYVKRTIHPVVVGTH